MNQLPPVTPQAADLARSISLVVFAELRLLPEADRIPALLHLVARLESDVGGCLSVTRRKPVLS